jgi:hypothetical protein
MSQGGAFSYQRSALGKIDDGGFRSDRIGTAPTLLGFGDEGSQEIEEWGNG